MDLRWLVFFVAAASLGSVCSLCEHEYHGSLSIPSPSQTENCTYTITVELDENLIIYVFEFDLDPTSDEHNFTCMGNYIIISEIENFESQGTVTLGPYCGRNAPKRFTFTSEKVVIEYVVKNTSRFDRFQFLTEVLFIDDGYIHVDYEFDKRAILTNSIWISSPGYPEATPNPLKIDWSIDFATSRSSSIVMREFELSNTTNCAEFASLVLRLPDIETLCGSKKDIRQFYRSDSKLIEFDMTTVASKSSKLLIEVITRELQDCTLDGALDVSLSQCINVAGMYLPLTECRYQCSNSELNGTVSCQLDGAWSIPLQSICVLTTPTTTPQVTTLTPTTITTTITPATITTETTPTMTTITTTPTTSTSTMTETPLATSTSTAITTETPLTATISTTSTPTTTVTAISSTTTPLTATIETTITPTVASTTTTSTTIPPVTTDTTMQNESTPKATTTKAIITKSTAIKTTRIATTTTTPSEAFTTTTPATITKITTPTLMPATTVSVSTSPLTTSSFLSIVLCLLLNYYCR